ncbi:MAG TPA: NAD-dependent succinate-semialdehyde dehydrogenase [Vicinamibacterales bacterium]|nr:NAD-dependent succinate-semialdehyde dehydrogenase [Vicinamibacterales bacterium]
MKSINPATGEVLATYETLDERGIEERLARAAHVAREWRQTSLDHRATRMRAAADVLEKDAKALGRLVTVEMGRPIAPAIDEILKSARGCRYYAEHAARFLADEEFATEAARSYVRYEPLGVVLAVMPWNFPFWQVFRFAAPALMAGNVGLLKHASNVPQCALAIEEVFTRAGFPHGTFQTLLISSPQVAALIDDDRVAAVTLTGSEGAGRDVASRAGKAIKRTVLELGGSDPFIVLPSADLAKAVATAVKSRTVNNGESCIAAKRFIVSSPIYDEFLSRFADAMAALRVGDPLDPATEIGPLATPAIVDDLEQQVRASVAAGARLVTGGGRIDRPGNFFAPTVLADIPTGSPAYSEELFGPVASVFRAADADDALRIANDTTFGLASSVWTTDAAERDRFIAGMEAGQVFVNAMVASDPRVPFGGIKRSGYGRELSMHGIREFVNAKTVWIA